MTSRDKETGKFVTKADAEHAKSMPDQTHVPATDDPENDDRLQVAADSETTAEQYPTHGLTAYDDMDREVRIKAGLVSDGQGNTPFGKLTFDEKLVDYIARKTAAAKKAGFQTWFARNFDKLDEGRKKVARELYAGFYREREATLEQNLDTLKKLALIKIWGIRSREDLALKYAADAGLIDTAYLQNLLHPESVVSERGAQYRYVTGFMNPRATVPTGYDADAELITPAMNGRFVPNIFPAVAQAEFGPVDHVRYLKDLQLI